MGQTETWVGLPRPFVENAETLALLKLTKAQEKRKRGCTVKDDERSVKIPDAALCVKVTRLEIQWDKRPSFCEAVGLSPYNAVVLGCFVARMGRMGSCGPRLRSSMRRMAAVEEGCVRTEVKSRLSAQVEQQSQLSHWPLTCIIKE